MYLGEYRNLGGAAWVGLGDDIDWQEVTYLPTSFQAGQDTGYSLPTYFDPSWNTDWLASIGFTSNPWTGRHKIDVPDVQVGYGEQAYMGPGPLPDGWVWHPGGVTVSASDQPWVEWTPVRQFERDHGYRQQYYWMGDNRYARYVDSAGNQVGPVVQTYKESKITKIIGKAVQLVAGAMVAVGGAQAIGAIAAGASGSATGAAASGAAPGAAESITAAAAAPAATSTAAEVATAAAVPAASVVAPAAAGGGGIIATAASALPAVGTVVKGVMAVAPIVKTYLTTKQKQDMANAAATPLPIAPPANMVPPPSGLMPSGGTPQFSPFPGSGGSAPSWLIPAAIGGGILALVMMNRRRQPTRRRV
jgi:hypothetical protein